MGLLMVDRGIISLSKSHGVKCVKPLMDKGFSFTMKACPSKRIHQQAVFSAMLKKRGAQSSNLHEPLTKLNLQNRINMAKAIKAVRAQIFLGDISLNVYQMPDGTYRLAGKNVTDAIQEEHKSLGRFYGVKSLKDLPSNDLALGTIKSESGESFIPVAIEDAAKYWYSKSLGGNELAQALALACLIESIERRADAAFGIQRTDEERNQRLQQRLEGKATRYEWTDAIQLYAERHHGELSDNWIRFVWSNCSDAANRAVLGMKASKFREQFNLEKDEPLRDHLDTKELRLLAEIEHLAVRLTLKEDLEPYKAAMESAKILRIEPEGRFAA
jgi:hypothetical protein